MDDHHENGGAWAHIGVPPGSQPSLFSGHVHPQLLATAPESRADDPARSRNTRMLQSATPESSPFNQDYSMEEPVAVPESGVWVPTQETTSYMRTRVAPIIVAAWVGGSVLIVAALITLFIFVYKNRRRKKKGTRKNDSVELQTPTGGTDAASGEVIVNVSEEKMGTSHAKIPESSGSNSSSSAQSSTPNRRATNTFTYEELVVATSGFSNNNLIGQGGFGYVYQGILSNGKLVAIKQLKDGSFQGDREFQAEIEIIGRIHHRNLVSLVGYSIEGDQKLLVYEYLANNSLAYHLHAPEAPIILTWDVRMQIALGSAKGLAYLHEDCDPKIIHRDIKATNILLDLNFSAKVSDFGLARFIAEAETHVTTRVMGTLGYLAPEYASSGKLTEKSDVYSFGIVLLELISGRDPIDLVDWARPLLADAGDYGTYDELADPKLDNSYNNVEMGRMAACAEACIHPFANSRPQMIQIARVLEGILTPKDLRVKLQSKNFRY